MPDPPQAWIAARNELAADPVGRARGVAPVPPPKPPPAPCGGVTPWAWRHLPRAEFSDVLEEEVFDVLGLEPVPADPPQAVTATTVASAAAVRPAGLKARRARSLPARSKRRINRFLPLQLAGDAHRGHRGGDPLSRHLQSRGCSLRSRCGSLAGLSAVAESTLKAVAESQPGGPLAGRRRRKVAPCPGAVSTVS